MKTFYPTLCVSFALSIFLSACNSKNPYGGIDVDVKIPPVIPPETTNKFITLEIENASGIGGEIRQLDIFSYSDHLLQHRNIPHYQDTIHIPVVSQSGVVVILANAFGSFNHQGLYHHDAWNEVSINLKNDNPLLPIMRDMIHWHDPVQTLTSKLKPLLCEIRLRSITHYLGDTFLLESPRVWLESASTYVALFREGNYPPINQEDTSPVFMPNDIGIYTQYPNISLWCYPNETPITPTSPPTKLIMEYELNGKTCKFSQEIHPILANGISYIDINIK